jgi:hypothetical protein
LIEFGKNGLQQMYDIGAARKGGCGSTSLSACNPLF